MDSSVTHIGMEIRLETHADLPGIRALLTEAFETDAEAHLVDRLRECNAFIPELSLVAEIDSAIVGHILLTRAAIIRDSARAVPAPGLPVPGFPVLALAPMAVTPARQRTGIGAALIHRALTDAASLGHELVIVLGHSDYYPRFGFVPASTYGITAPFDVPDEVFMAQWLGDAAARRVDGVVQYAEPFAQLT